MTVLLGRCDEDIGGAPDRPFAEALAHYVMHAEDEVLARTRDFPWCGACQVGARSLRQRR